MDSWNESSFGNIQKQMPYGARGKNVPLSPPLLYNFFVKMHNRMVLFDQCVMNK